MVKMAPPWMVSIDGHPEVACTWTTGTQEGLWSARLVVAETKDQATQPGSETAYLATRLGHHVYLALTLANGEDLAGYAGEGLVSAVVAMTAGPGDEWWESTILSVGPWSRPLRIRRRAAECTICQRGHVDCEHFTARLTK